MKESKKIVFLTFHTWKTKRQGGFHKFAEYSVKLGYQTIFFTFPRSIFDTFRRSNVYNFKINKKLSKGISYEKGRLKNTTLLTLELPIPTRIIHHFPSKILNFFGKLSISSFKKYAKLNFSNTDYFVFESTSSVMLVDTIKAMFPESKIIYRPSDPLIAFKYGKRFYHYELNILKKADLVLLVNIEGYNLYAKNFSNFSAEVNYKILSNGVDLNLFRKKYSKPKALKIKNTALYVGARPIDWQVVLKSAQMAEDINFIIVCPVDTPKSLKKRVREQKNIHHIKGIERNQVPRWVTNSDIIIIPNPKNWYKTRPWGITAKYYQAMAAKKPIISYHDTLELKKFDIPVTYDIDSFVNHVRKVIDKKEIHYKIDLNEKDWSNICKNFFAEIESL